MGDKPPASVYSIVEKAYFRLQAGDVLSNCLEDGSVDPLHEMIQEMVIAGPQSLDALREILNEAAKRKTQVLDDLNQVTDQLSIIFKGYGISLQEQDGDQSSLLSVRALSEESFQALMDEQEIHSVTQSECLKVLRESQDLIATLNSKIQLLENIETYLKDWLWGLTYEFIRQGKDEGSKEVGDVVL